MIKPKFVPMKIPTQSAMMVSIIPHVLQYWCDVEVSACLANILCEYMKRSPVFADSVALFFHVVGLKDSGNDEAVT